MEAKLIDGPHNGQIINVDGMPLTHDDLETRLEYARPEDLIWRDADERSRCRTAQVWTNSNQYILPPG